MLRVYQRGRKEVPQHKRAKFSLTRHTTNSKNTNKIANWPGSLAPWPNCKTSVSGPNPDGASKTPTNPGGFHAVRQSCAVGGDPKTRLSNSAHFVDLRQAAQEAL